MLSQSFSPSEDQMNLKDQITKVASDLINLEVNTIIKSNILGTKMPDPRHALLDIAKDYQFKLIELHFPASNGDSRQIELEDLTGGESTFQKICAAADRGIKSLSDKQPGSTQKAEIAADVWMLNRIKDMSGQIAGTVFKQSDNEFTRELLNKQHPEPMKLSADNLILIRKAWEMGTEEIAMQTVIQLDGDVVTRVQPKYALNTSASIHEIHRENVRVSVQFWNELVQVVKDFFASVVKAFWPKG